MTGPVCGLVPLLSSIDPGQIIAVHAAAGGGGSKFKNKTVQYDL